MMSYDWVDSLIVFFQVFVLWIWFYVFSIGIYLASRVIWDGGSPISKGHISRNILLVPYYVLP